MFLDISKAFDRVWRDELLPKLEQNGVCGSFFQLIIRILSGRFQRIILNGQTIDLETIRAGVPTGFNLRRLFFLIHNDDLTNNLKRNVKLFADDNSLFSEICDL